MGRGARACVTPRSLTLGVLNVSVSDLTKGGAVHADNIGHARRAPLQYYVLRQSTGHL